MSALTGEVRYDRRGTPARNVFGYPVAPGEKVWLGSLVGINASGQMQRIQTSGTVAFLGLSSQTLDNTASATASSIIVEAGKGTWALPVPSAAPANINAPVYATDDGTLTLSSNALGSVGTLVGIEGGRTFVNLIGS